MRSLAHSLAHSLTRTTLVQDGTAGSSGDTCGMIGEASVAYIDAVNALNGGLGFEVLAGREQPLYFRLNYTQNNFDDGTYESVGADKGELMKW